MEYQKLHSTHLGSDFETHKILLPSTLFNIYNTFDTIWINPHKMKDSQIYCLKALLSYEDSEEMHSICDLLINFYSDLFGIVRIYSFLATGSYTLVLYYQEKTFLSYLTGR